MPQQAQRNIFGLAGLALCLVSGGFDAIQLWIGGGNRSFPLGRLARWAASLFASPATLLSAGSDHALVAQQLALGLYLVLVVLFARIMWRNTSAPQPRQLAFPLAAQMAIALAYPHTLLYLMAAQLGMLLPLGGGLRWLGAQQLLLVLVVLAPLAGSDAMGADSRLRFVLLSLGTMMVWQAIAFGIGYMAASERRARLALAASNGELRATQILLVDTVRSGERMRIARDLHDIVGHHLTALHLHLDLALRQRGAGAEPALLTARNLASSLLSEVRLAVGAERNAAPIALREALGALCKSIPAPRITLSIQDDLEIDSAVLAHALFCCVQEAISNAVRHADASELTVSLMREDDAVALRIADNGRGKGASPEGHGLRGMRERLAALGGTLCAASTPQRGFVINIAVPVHTSPA